MAPLCIISIVLLQGIIAPRNDWDYSDEDIWYQSYPSCGNADESPINIETKNVTNNLAQCNDGQFDWNLNLNHKMFQIINTGHTTKIVTFIHKSIPCVFNVL